MLHGRVSSWVGRSKCGTNIMLQKRGGLLTAGKVIPYAALPPIVFEIKELALNPSRFSQGLYAALAFLLSHRQVFHNSCHQDSYHQAKDFLHESSLFAKLKFGQV